MTGPARVEPTSVRGLLLSPTTTAGALMGGTIGAYTAGPADTLAGFVIGAAVGAAYGYAVDAAFAHHGQRNEADASPNSSRRS